MFTGKRITITLLTITLTAALASPATAAESSPNPWLDQRVMNMAHSGGEMEAPGNTMYAFERAVELGSEMIELDVQSTADNELVVLHDSTVDETTNGSGEITEMTTSEVRQLDAAYNFVPDVGTDPEAPDDAFALRGVRTGEQPPPEGYSAADFAVPTLDEVFDRFPDTPINIEIKGNNNLDVGSFKHNAELLADFVIATGRDDLIVTSFNDTAVARFAELAPRIGLAPGMKELTGYVLTGAKPIEGTVALQIPVTLIGAIPIATPELIARAHGDGYAVHVWFSGSAPEDTETYNSLVDSCADALMPGRPGLFEQILNDGDIVRPGQPGHDPCEQG